MIPFNKPYLSGKELEYISQAVAMGKLSGNGFFTRKCHQFFEERHGFQKCLLTTSCTDALEMTALLAGIEPGDEVILPSYTFVSTANAFALRGANLVFCDSRPDHPGMDESVIESLITEKTRAIVPVHYAGVACDMQIIMDLSAKYNLTVIEDAAHATDSHYINPEGKKMPLGSFGHLAAFSFHETKNINSGEGGMLVINDQNFIQRAEILWEKGTNRTAFFRGEVDKYNWVDVGSSFLPSELTSAFLYAQLEELDDIQNKRKFIRKFYYDNLKDWAEERQIAIPKIPDFAEDNGHMFYLVLPETDMRTRFIQHLKENGILSVFHYLSLHSSPYYRDRYAGPELVNADRYSDCLVRLPLYYELENVHLQRIIHCIKSF